MAGSFMAFQNPRLSLAHLSFSFTVFSALGSGCISRKFSPGTGGGALAWAGGGAHQVEPLPPPGPPSPAPLWGHSPPWFPALQKRRELRAEKEGAGGWVEVHRGPLAKAVVSVGRGAESFGCGERRDPS